MSTLYRTGARAICGVNTKTGFTSVTFCGDARTCKGSGGNDFNRKICQSASADCRNESGNSDWAKAMKMAANVCAYAQGGKDALPPGVKAFYRPR